MPDYEELQHELWQRASGYDDELRTCIHCRQMIVCGEEDMVWFNCIGDTICPESGLERHEPWYSDDLLELEKELRDA